MGEGSSSEGGILEAVVRALGGFPSRTTTALLGGAAGIFTTLLVQVWWKRRSAQVFELGGLYYELLGYAWDHQVKDFKVLYRPLYDCAAKKGSFERHALAVSHFARWEEKFKGVGCIPLSLTCRIFSWPDVGCSPTVVPGAVAAKVEPAQSLSHSGFGTRSLDPCSLEHVVGDFHAFIDALLAGLKDKIDVLSFQMDHICYRCETQEEYTMVVEALRQQFGEVMTEANIGGRPVATVLLHTAIEHPPFQIEAIEVASPKPGRPYKSGLEHAEFVVGSELDGFRDTSRLRRFMLEHPSLSFDIRALNKEINADVSLSVNGGAAFGAITAKFHQRPLAEVVRYEQGLAAG